MNSTRRTLLVLVGLLAALTAAVLWEVLATVFFAITVVYVAEPLYRRLVARGLSPWWASAATTVAVFASAVAVVAPFGVVLYQRRDDVVDMLEGLPAEIPVTVSGFEYVLVTGDLFSMAASFLRDLAIGLAAATPVLAVKVTLMGIVVFALLVRKESAAAAILAAVQPRHRRIVGRLNDRVRETLLAIYVLQAATALGTFAIALPLFAILGLQFPFVLAVLAGLLQFLPIVGPSLLVAGLVAAELLAGDALGALLVGVVGWFFVAFLPDVLIRPRLAERTANVPGSLYFIGFTGGLLTLGAVGVIAGPVVVVLLHEAVALVAEETAVDPAGTLVETD